MARRDRPARPGARDGPARGRRAGRGPALRRSRLGLPARRRRAPVRAGRGRGAARQPRPARGRVRGRRGALPRAGRAARASSSSSSASGPAPRPGNLQAWARDARLSAAARLAGPTRGARVATGHTSTDQAETILYRLAASPGRRALLGMRAQRRPARPAAARRDARGDRRALPRARPAVARGLVQRLGLLRAHARAGRPRARAAGAAPGGRAQRRAHRRAAARGGRGARRARRRPCSPAATASRPRTWRPCRRRSPGSSCGGSPRTPPGACARARPGVWTSSWRCATARWTWARASRAVVGPAASCTWSADAVRSGTT